MFRFLAAGLGLALLMLSRAWAQAPQPPVEAYGTLPFVSQMDLSPDGTRLALKVVDGEQIGLIVLQIDGERLLTMDMTEQRARGIRFVDNDHLLVWLSETTRANMSRYEFDFSGVVSVNISEGKAQQLFYRTRDLHPRQSSLGRVVGMNPETRELYMPAYEGDTAVPYFNLYRNELMQSRGWKVVEGSSHTIDWFVTEDGTPLAREDMSGRSDTYEVLHYEDRRWHTIYEEEAETPPISVIAVTPERDGLYFISSGANDGAYDALYKLGFDGEISGPFLGREAADIDQVYTDWNRVFQGVRYSGMMPSYQFSDPVLQANVDKMLARASDAAFYIQAWSEDYSRILVRAYDGHSADRYLLYDVESDQLLGLPARYQNIPDEAVGPYRAFTYSAQDGLEIPAIITYPPSSAETRSMLPTIVLPHGGPAAYDKIDFDWMVQYFASRGYLVFQPNFRGSSGFGYDFQTAGDGEWGGKMQDDITDGVRELIAAGLTDPDRICIVGASYGGYAALAGGAFTPDLYKCVISIAGVSDLEEMLDWITRRRGHSHWTLSYWEKTIGNGETRNDWLDARSPSQNAEAFTAPVLLIHGDDDTVVPLDQSQRMRRALNRAGKEVEFVRLRGEDHWLSDGETRIETLRAIDSFLAKHMPAD